MKKTSKPIRVGEDLYEDLRNLKKELQQEDPGKYVSDDKALRHLLKNKKGFIGDAISGVVFLFYFFILLSIAIFLMFSFNTGFQDSNADAESKAISKTFVEDYPTKIGYMFSGAFIALFIYTMITAYLIEVISKIWFIVGFISSIIFVIIAAIIKAVFGELITQSLFASSLPFVYGAVLFFTYLPGVVTAWVFMLALVLYLGSQR